MPGLISFSNVLGKLYIPLTTSGEDIWGSFAYIYPPPVRIYNRLSREYIILRRVMLPGETH